MYTSCAREGRGCGRWKIVIINNRVKESAVYMYIYVYTQGAGNGPVPPRDTFYSHTGGREGGGFGGLIARAGCSHFSAAAAAAAAALHTPHTAPGYLGMRITIYTLSTKN